VTRRSSVDFRFVGAEELIDASQSVSEVFQERLDVNGMPGRRSGRPGSHMSRSPIDALERS
jgi:hypothetical protein